MKKYTNFIVEKINQKKLKYIDIIISYLNKNTNYSYAKYSEKFIVNKLSNKSKYESILFLMINLDNEKERKAIRFNFTNFTLYSIDMWEDFTFNLTDGPIYNNPSWELKIKNSIIDILDDILAFVEGEFSLYEYNVEEPDINKSPTEEVQSDMDDLENINLDIFEAIKYNTLQVAFNDKTTSFILSGLPGLGKCLAKGTKIIMSDGHLKSVEDVMNGEYVMGVDSTPKVVSGVNSGVSIMYEIQQNKGINYTVNQDHILTLKKSIKAKNNNYFSMYDDIISISISDYLEKNNHFKNNFYGYKVAIDFQEQDLEIAPYYLGLWLGDGFKHETSICTVDDEIKNYIYEYAEQIGQKVSKYQPVDKSRMPTYHIIDHDFQKKGNIYKNRLFEKMKSLKIIKNKHIPDIYKYNSKENRLQLLAGLIDSDGSTIDGAGYEITQKRKDLIYDIKFLADSLGFKTNLTETIKKIKKINFSGLYYRLTIFGNTEIIPVILDRKKTNTKRKVNHLITGFKVVEKPIDEYYGFTVEDSLYLLEDTTVVHNTYDVTHTLDEVRKPYQYFKGNSSPAGLYELLFKYRTELLVLDDMDDALNSKDTADMLKSVLDTGEKRVLDRRMKGYFDAVGLTDEEIQKQYDKTGKLPNRFEFTGSIIFITNLKEDDFDAAVYTRTLSLDINLEKEEILKRIKKIMPHMHPNISMEMKQETFDLMINLTDIYVSKLPINLRTFYHLINFRISNDFNTIIDGKSIPLWKLLIKTFLVRKTKLSEIEE